MKTLIAVISTGLLLFASSIAMADKKDKSQNPGKSHVYTYE